MVHERIELAAVARAVLDRLDPAMVAVELPWFLSVTMRSSVSFGCARPSPFPLAESSIVVPSTASQTGGALGGSVVYLIAWPATTGAAAGW